MQAKQQAANVLKGAAKAQTKDSLKAFAKLTHEVDGEPRIISDPPLIVAISVDQLRLLQCDTAVTSDVFLLPSEVGKHQISGFGGSDMSPALRHLADDPRVEAVVVLTDGDIAYPPERMPYDVLWVLSAQGSAAFRPPYGQVIRMLPS